MNYLKIQKRVALTMLCLPFLSQCIGKTSQPELSSDIPKKCIPHIIQTIPHDGSAFTQGLFYYNGKLFESTGIYEQSTLRIIDTSGGITLKKPISYQFFAEGCAPFQNKLFQITWKEQTCFVYSMPNLLCIDTLFYTGEGWGLTTNETNFIMSNGSDTLYFRNQRFEIVRKLPVTISQKPLTNLNELDYAQGSIFANVWFSDYIFEINPQTGKTQRVIDCSAIVAREAPTSDQAVLNGIAYNPQNKQFYITGKNWKNIFIVELPN
jgi:glutaminyl-peptide cyclotransferase